MRGTCNFYCSILVENKQNLQVEGAFGIISGIEYDNNNLRTPNGEMIDIMDDSWWMSDDGGMVVPAQEEYIASWFGHKQLVGIQFFPMYISVNSP